MSRGTKRCNKCGQWKDKESGFYVGRGQCKDCCNDRRGQYRCRPWVRDRENKWQRERWKNSPMRPERKAYDKARGLARKYRLTINQFNDLLASQAGCCASCKVRLDSSTHAVVPCVDHSHVTGDVRGILCRSCNTAEGWLKTPDNAMLLADYMRKHCL
jgi:hypothetical protein